MTTKGGDSPVSTGAVAVVIAAELRRLEPLSAWVPVAQRVDAIAQALQGGEGVRPKDVTEVRDAARRWSRLSPALQAFYADVAPRDERASWVLWSLIFEGRPKADLWRGPIVGHMQRLWQENYGTTPTMTLYPSLEV